MQIPNFHDGLFEGIHLGPSGVVHLFFRTESQKSMTVTLHGAAAIKVSGIMTKNIVLDVITRGTAEITQDDIAEIYGTKSDSVQTNKLLSSTRERKLQLLELNPSYGAEGLI